MTNYIRVKDADGVVRDSVSKAIISNDRDSFESFRQKRALEKQTNSRITTLENRLESIERMLMQLLESKTK